MCRFVGGGELGVDEGLGGGAGGGGGLGVDVCGGWGFSCWVEGLGWGDGGMGAEVMGETYKEESRGM
jgi:hypothetical protein